MKTLLQLIAIGLVIMCFSKCKSAGELFDKALDKDSVVVAKKSLSLWPCVTTDIIIGDSSAIKEWMKTAEETANFYEELLKSKPQFDTVVKWNKDEACEENYNTCAGQYRELYKVNEALKKQFDKLSKQKPPVRVDTVFKDDNKKIFIANKEAESFKAQATALQSENKTLQTKATRRGIENWVWRVIAVVMAFFWIKGKLTTIKIQRL